MQQIPASTSSADQGFRPDSLAASVAVLLLANLIQRTVGFGRGVLFCRWLSPEELGTWDMAYSFLLLAAPLVVIGLPGSFGRYLERYRQRGQLRAFLRRASAWTAALTTLAVALLLVCRQRFSELVFGSSDQQQLVLVLIASLVFVIVHHFLEALFAALRKFRIVSTMHFCQSLVFAIISLGLLICWRTGAESIVVGYGAACMVSASFALVWNARNLAAVAPPGDAPPHAQFWPPLVRFAVLVWLTNMLCQLFAVTDRYMLIHISGLESAEALVQVGHYHASRVLPLLFLSLADLLAGVVLPYLSHDWEAGLRERVAERLNIVLKFSALATLAAGVAVLWVAPLLFHVAFQGRYDGGLAVLPFTLTYCSWYGLVLIAQTYLWCAERMKTGLIPLACGLVANTLLNFLLIPLWGLRGAVISTTISTGLALAVLYYLNHRNGMKLQFGVVWLSLSLAALSGGLLLSAIVLVALLAALPWSRTLVSNAERKVIGRLVDDVKNRWHDFVVLRLGKAGKNRAGHSVNRASHEVAAALSRGRQPTEA